MRGADRGCSRRGPAQDGRLAGKGWPAQVASSPGLDGPGCVPTSGRPLPTSDHDVSIETARCDSHLPRNADVADVVGPPSRIWDGLGGEIDPEKRRHTSALGSNRLISNTFWMPTLLPMWGRDGRLQFEPTSLKSDAHTLQPPVGPERLSREISSHRFTARSNEHRRGGWATIRRAAQHPKMGAARGNPEG
jgi:hypothetical protein